MSNVIISQILDVITLHVRSVASGGSRSICDPGVLPNVAASLIIGPDARSRALIYVLLSDPNVPIGINKVAKIISFIIL